MKPLKTKVSITLDDNIIKEIKDLAEKDDRSFSQYINKILKNHYRTIDFLKKIDLIFSHLREDIKILFSSLDLLNTFGNNLIFLRFLYLDLVIQLLLNF